MYINHAGCVILQVKLWILEKKINYNLFHFNNNGYNHIWAKEESNSLQNYILQERFAKKNKLRCYPLIVNVPL